jgi:hypothetical protein
MLENTNVSARLNQEGLYLESAPAAKKSWRRTRRNKRLSGRAIH